MLQFFVRREPKISFVKRKMPRLAYVCRVDGRHGQVPRAMHLHEERAEAVLVLQGSGSYNIAEKQYTAQAGDVLFFNSGVLHDETAVEDRDIVTLCIAVQGLELHGCRRNALLPENIAPLVHLGEDFSSVERMFSLLVDRTIGISDTGTDCKAGRLCFAPWRAFCADQGRSWPADQRLYRCALL